MITIDADPQEVAWMHETRDLAPPVGQQLVQLQRAFRECEDAIGCRAFMEQGLTCGEPVRRALAAKTRQIVTLEHAADGFVSGGAACARMVPRKRSTVSNGWCEHVTPHVLVECRSMLL
jgi:hypothetical protein